MCYNKIMNIIEVDRVALWRRMGVSGLTTRQHPAGTAVKERGAEDISRTTAKLYRYAKDYENFCLFARTYSQNAAAVEKQLDAIAAKVTPDQVAEMMSGTILEPASFVYLDEFLKEDD